VVVAVVVGNVILYISKMHGQLTWPQLFRATLYERSDLCLTA